MRRYSNLYNRWTHLYDAVNITIPSIALFRCQQYFPFNYSLMWRHFMICDRQLVDSAIAARNGRYMCLIKRNTASNKMGGDYRLSSNVPGTDISSYCSQLPFHICFNLEGATCRLACSYDSTLDHYHEPTSTNQRSTSQIWIMWNVIVFARRHHL